MNKYKSLLNLTNKVLFFVFVASYYSINAQVITKGPYLAEPEATSITIRWESDIQAPYIVKYGNDKEMMLFKNAKQLDSIKNHFLYEAKIEDLATGEKYFYQVAADDFESEISEFKCNVKSGKPITFVVTGDSRSHPKIFETIVEKVNQLNPDLIISMGDVVIQGGEYSQWGKYYFDVAQKIINHIPLISTLGDHEGVDDEGKLFTHFLFPHKNFKELWFSYTYGDAHFVVLDYRYPTNKKMIEWFERDMSNSESEWNIVYMHRPSYNLGGHHSAWGRDIWPELFNKYKIDIVFAGHSHLYERFYPVKPQTGSSEHAVTYITTGGSGASLYKTGQSSVLAFAKSIHHYITVNIDGKQIKITAYKKDGAILDQISWVKGSEEFKELIRTQEELDIVGMLVNTISERLKRLPMKSIPASTKIKLNPVFCKEKVDYTISLTEESKKNYKMEIVSSITTSDKPTVMELKIFAKGDMTVTKWGEITPSIQIKADYKTDSLSGSVIIKDIEYQAY